MCTFFVGWSGVAKVSCILRHRGVQLILTYSWARPAFLIAGKRIGGTFFISSVSSLSFLFLFFPCPSLSSPQLSLLFLFSLSLGDNIKWPTWVKKNNKHFTFYSIQEFCKNGQRMPDRTAHAQSDRASAVRICLEYPFLLVRLKWLSFLIHHKACLIGFGARFQICYAWVWQGHLNYERCELNRVIGQSFWSILRPNPPLIATEKNNTWY